jgi:hypothetical protein
MQFQKLSEIKVERLPTCLAFNSHSQHLFIGDGAGNIYCHDVASGTRLATLQWHQHSVMAFGFYQGYLYSLDEFQNLVAWNLSNYQVAQRLDLKTKGGSPYAVEISHFTYSGKHLILGIGSSLYIVQVEDGQFVRELYLGCHTRIGFDSLESLSISRDDTQLIVIFSDQVDIVSGDINGAAVYIMQLGIENGEEICGYCIDDFWPQKPFDYHRAVPGFSSDKSRILISDGCYGTLYQFNDTDEFEFSSDGVFGSFDCSPVSDIVAFGDTAGNLCLRDMETKEYLFEEQVFQAPIQQVLFSIHGKYIAVVAGDLNFGIWQLL